jgi:RNA polymerase sigma factor (sigma-70 family)
MTERDDHQLLAEFARANSEPAFATLVTRHVGLVYSVALRSTGNAHAAEEISQAVFIILARKADKMPRHAVLSGWLYQTTRLTAANYLRGEIRRHHREQEAYMQSTLNEPESDANQVWHQVAPLLDGALDKLGTKDRDALALRFFENKSMAEVGTALGASEDAAKMRVNRALEKLRKLFTKRGVMFSATLITSVVAANSVQAAPVGLAKTISAVAITKGAAAGGSTLALVKGALKIMAWTKAKMAIVVGVAILAGGTTTIAVSKGVTRMNSVLTQHLEDGSTLVLNRISFGDRHDFSSRGRTNTWSWPGHDELVLEFRLTGKNSENHPLVNSTFFRQFRCILRGEHGIEYVEEFLPNQFRKDAGGFYGYMQTSIFPRASRWLWVQVEKRETNDRYDAWQRVAEFKFPNPASAANQNWGASPTPMTNTVAGMDFVLGEITVKTVPNLPHDIWNHVVTVPTEVFENGVQLTNWARTFTTTADASGNWSSGLQGHRSLDPRYVWKLEMDFEPESNFPSENVMTVNFPARLPKSGPVVLATNLMDLPVTISWDGYWLNASIPTNNPDLALKYICAKNDQGETLKSGGSSWGKFGFRQGSFMVHRGEVLQMGGTALASVTFAIVPNVHTTFYAQPRIVTEPMK